MTHTNVDPDEIAKFEALASRWWDENSEFKPLHDINPLRASWIDRFSEVKGKKLIDVGCGGGLLSEAMAHRGASVTGIDMGEALVSGEDSPTESQLDVEYRQTTAETIAEERPETYDVVTCLEMLEHVRTHPKLFKPALIWRSQALTSISQRSIETRRRGYSPLWVPSMY